MRNVLALLCLIGASACTATTISNGRIGGISGDRDVGVTFTTADVRVIEERSSPLVPSRKIVCTEPSPDVAKALAASAQGQGSGGDGSVNVSLSGGFSSAEALLELAGRSTALLGLRDGLFRACEAYANGAIGDAAYALVLSRYGQLMVALFLAQDIQNATAPANNSISAPTVSVNGSNTTGSTGNSSKAPAAAGGAKAGQEAADTAAANAEPVQAAPAAAQADWRAYLQRTAYVPGGAAEPPAAVGPAGSPERPVPGAVPGSPDTTAKVIEVPQGYTVTLTPPKPLPHEVAKPPAAPKKDAPTPPKTADAGSSSNGGPEAIAEIAKDYFALGETSNLPNLLLVACIDEFDSTRPSVGSMPVHTNGFLRTACQTLQGRLPAILASASARQAPAPAPKPKPIRPAG